MRIDYSYEDHPLGTAGPLSLVKDSLTSTFLVTNGDVLTDLDFTDLIEYHKHAGAAATIAMHKRDVKIDLGVLQFNGNYDLTGYIEKPTYNFHVSMGVYVFEPSVLQQIPYGEYLDFPDLVLRLIGRGERVVGYPFEGYWQDLGRPGDYEQAIEEFEKIRNLILKDGIQ
jgi:NDP-sugar pyrophosphorylase family protein